MPRWARRYRGRGTSGGSRYAAWRSAQIDRRVTTAHGFPATMPNMGTEPDFWHRMAAFMFFVAVTLWVASALHLLGAVHGRTKSFSSSGAGTAELVIGMVVAAGAAAVQIGSERGRPFALAAIGFTIVGFLVGLSFTARGGALPDIAYHLTVLPLLVAAFITLVRHGPNRQGKGLAAAGSSPVVGDGAGAPLSRR